MVEFDKVLVKKLLKNINKQAQFANKMGDLAKEQDQLFREILGDDLPEFDAMHPSEDFNETLALSTVDGEGMSMPELMDLLNRARSRLDGEEP